MSETENMEMAKAILNQLGGMEFVRMTGSKNFLRLDDGLRMDLTNNQSGANRLLITLKGDEYDLYFYRMAILKHAEVRITHEQRFDRIQAEELRRTFEEVTGLDTRMPRVFQIRRR